MPSSYKQQYRVRKMLSSLWFTTTIALLLCSKMALTAETYDAELFYQRVLGLAQQAYDPIFYITAAPEDDIHFNHRREMIDSGVVLVYSEEQFIYNTNDDQMHRAFVFIADQEVIKFWNLSKVVLSCNECEFYIPRWALDYFLPGVINLKSQIYVYEKPTEGTNSVTVLEAFSLPTRHHIIYLDTFGTWTTDGQFISYQKSSIWDRRSNLMGITIRVITKSSISTAVNFDPTKKQFDGPYIDILYALAERLNFTVELKSPLDGNWGAKTANGSWNGMMAMLIRGEGDMIMTAFSVTKDRNEEVTYALGLESTIVGFIMLRPGYADTVDIHAFISIFRSETWILAAATLLTLVLFITLPSIYNGHQLRRSFYMATEQSLKATILLADVPTSSQTASLRLNLIILSLFSLLLFQHYTGSLISYMTASTPAKPINSFRELYDREFELYAIGFSSQSEILKTSNPGSGLYDFYHKRMQSSNFMSDDELMQLAGQRDPNIAIMTNNRGPLPTEDHIFSTGIEDGFQDMWAPAFPKNSEIEPLISHHILKMKQSGLIDIILKKNYYLPAFQEWKSPIQQPFEIKFTHVNFVWFLLILGVIISGLILGVEKLHAFKKV